ncbi:MAG TPA: SMP-30/gluconolactonase/LRE family protein, partial [Gemmataceae bacterium]|nr:SMP-30/gluconolactonase/LRE family protein [Gemmataceae bacterium]
MSTPTTEARILVTMQTEADRFLPEGPQAVTVADRPALAWVNIQTAADATCGAVHLRFWDTGERRRYDLPARPGFLRPTDRPGVIFVGREKDLGTLNLATGEWQTLATIHDANPRTIINDGTVVPGGDAVVFGTKDRRFADPIAHLYLFTLADRRVSVLADGQTCSNGKVFARDGEGLILYDIDTPQRVVTRYRFDLARRTATPDGVAIDLRAVEGFPDGMTDAGDGTVIVAFYNPTRGGTGHARRYDLRTVKLLEEWTTPGSPRVTCPLLVERDGGVELVLTTAVEGMPADQRAESPHAGDLFVAETGLSQLPMPDVLRAS